jgi:trehalose synthase
LEQLRRQRLDLSQDVRERVHLVSLPLDDYEDNAAMVNAIQRRADIIVQKGLAEALGMSVTEAMWKEKPVIASKIGGIKDQIVDGESGVLIDPGDLRGVGAAMHSLLLNPHRRHKFGVAAKARVVQQQLLTPGHVARYLELAERLV